MLGFEGDEAIPLEMTKCLIRTDTRVVTRQWLSSGSVYRLIDGLRWFAVRLVTSDTTTLVVV